MAVITSEMAYKTKKSEERRGEERRRFLTREHDLHQISLLNVTGIFNQLQDVVGGCVMLKQKNLVIDAVEAALWELYKEKHGRRTS